MRTTPIDHTLSMPGKTLRSSKRIDKGSFRTPAFILTMAMAMFFNFATTANAQIVMTFGSSGGSPIQIASGLSVDVPITAANLAGVSSLQFSLNWEPTELQYVSASVKNAVFTGTQFGNVGGGKLTVLWDDPLSVGPVSASGEILSIHFNAIGANGTGSSLSFGDSPTPRHLYDVNVTDISGVQWNSGSVSIAAVPEPTAAAVCFGVVCLLQAAVIRSMRRQSKA